MCQGRVVERGATEQVLDRPTAAYTRDLLADSQPRLAAGAGVEPTASVVRWSCEHGREVEARLRQALVGGAASSTRLRRAGVRPQRRRHQPGAAM